MRSGVMIMVTAGTASGGTLKNNFCIVHVHEHTANVLVVEEVEFASAGVRHYGKYTYGLVANSAAPAWKAGDDGLKLVLQHPSGPGSSVTEIHAAEEHSAARGIKPHHQPHEQFPYLVYVLCIERCTDCRRFSLENPCWSLKCAFDRNNMAQWSGYKS
ncbi:hypothetical protein B0H11DRAFT_1925936 [Mycena galericulata]|nr:hypothetical protein B0H11DRAFT_1925936 [Mycena galericulata]